MDYTTLSLILITSASLIIQIIKTIKKVGCITNCCKFDLELKKEKVESV